jgi:hypothetical protein
MTLYKTDFSEYAAGSQPSAWTERWTVGYGTTTVESKGDSLTLKALKSISTGFGKYALSWDAPGASVADVELLSRVQRNSIAANHCWIFARGSGTSSPNSYYLCMEGGARWSIGKFVTNTTTILGYNVKCTQADRWIWLRFRVQGTSLKAKIWYDGDAEPASWDIEVTDSSVSAGWVGAGISFGASNTSYFDFFAAETTSASWPIPVPYSLEHFSLNLAVQANAFDYFKMILDVTDGFVEIFSLNLEVVAQIIDSFKMSLEVVLNKLDNFKMLLDVTDGTMFDNFAMLLDVVDGTVFDNFMMELGVISATPAFRSVTAHRVSSVMSEVV